MPQAILVISEEVPPGHSHNWYPNTLDEMQEYCRRRNLPVHKVFPLKDRYLFQPNSELSQVVFQLSKTIDDIVVLVAGDLPALGAEDDISVHLRKLQEEKKIQIIHFWHPLFPAPAKNQRIWRYIDLPKFVDLLQSQSLHFSRADELQKYEPHEGRVLTAFMEAHLAAMERGEVAVPIPDMDAKRFVQLQRTSADMRRFLGWCFISCWHMSSFENFAMWKIYSDTFGICIESDFDRLRNAFVDKDWDYYDPVKKIFVTKVTYYDDNTYWMPEGNVFWPFIHKRNEFEYEKELRCIISDQSRAPFHRPKVDLKILVKAIHISPTAPLWFTEQVKKLAQSYGLDESLVVGSSLRWTPALPS